MPILTFRVNVPTATPAKNPVVHKLISGASALHSLMIWSTNTNADISECGFQLTNRLGTAIIPDIGSHDGFTFASGEDGWSPIPNQPHPIQLFDQVLEGPPYILEFRFYNIDAAAILVAGIVVVREPMAHLAQEAMIYEFMTARAPQVEDVSPETKTTLSSNGKKSGEAKINLPAFWKDNNPLLPKTNLKVEKK